MRHLILAALAAAFLPTLSAAEPEAAQRAARSLLASKADAVVVIRATVSMTVTAGDQPSQTQDRALETLGTVVDPSGLVVVAAASIDPGAFADGRTVQTPAGPMRLAVVSEVKEAFLVLADGTELPAKVVLKDKDLNLALLAPVTKAAQPLVGVDTSTAGELKVADEVVVLGRMGKGLERAPRVDVDSVCAAISKPRPLAVIHLPYPGCPVFDLEGRFAGLTTAKAEAGDDDSGAGVSMTPVVVPASVVRRFLDAGQKAAAAQPAPTSPSGEEKAPAPAK